MSFFIVQRGTPGFSVGKIENKIGIDALHAYMKDYPLERMMKEAKFLQIYEGTNQI